MSDKITTPAEALEAAKAILSEVRRRYTEDRFSTAWVGIGQAFVALDALYDRIAEPDGDAVDRVAQALYMADGRRQIGESDWRAIAWRTWYHRLARAALAAMPADETLTLRRALEADLERANETVARLRAAVAAERERCAGIIDREIETSRTDHESSDFLDWLARIAAAIRAGEGE